MQTEGDFRKSICRGISYLAESINCKCNFLEKSHERRLGLASTLSAEIRLKFELGYFIINNLFEG